MPKTNHKTIYILLEREGNGWTQREFLRLLALEKGLTLNLNPPDNKSVYDEYMQGIINSDLIILTKLILERIDSWKTVHNFIEIEELCKKATKRKSW